MHCNNIGLRYFKVISRQALLSASEIKCGLRYIIDIPATWEEYLKSFRQSFRRSINIANRKLNACENIKIYLIDKVGMVEPAMKVLRELEYPELEIKK